MDDKNNSEESCANKSIVEYVDNVKSTMLKRLDELANCLNDEELSKEYSKKDGHIKWKVIREIIRKELAEELKAEWESMWENEGLSDKLIAMQTLIKSTQSTSNAWRPKTGDINPQKLVLEKKKLLSEIEQLKTLNKEKEEQIESTKNKLSESWNKVRESQRKISEHMKCMEGLQQNMAHQFDAHYEQDIDDALSLDEINKDVQNTTLQECLNNIL